MSAEQTQRPPFRFALLMRDRELAAWESTSVARLQDRGGELAAVLIVASGDGAGGPLARFAERLAGGEVRAPRGADLGGVARIELGAADSPREVRALELDFAIALEPFDVLRAAVGDPDALAGRGVWTHVFAVGDERPTLPPGFDAVVRGEVATTVSLVRLTAAGEGRLLMREWLRVEPDSYALTRRALTRAAAELADRYLQRSGDETDADSTARLPSSAARGELAAMRLIITVGVRAVRHVLHRILYREDWNIGIIDRPIAEVLERWEPREIAWLPALPGDAFLADPFGIPLDDGGCLLLAEEFVGTSARGRIVAATIDGARYGSLPRPILELGVHLSYPFVLASDDGRWLFAPESSQAGEVGLYRAPVDGVDGPAERDGTLLAGFPAIDPTVVEHGGRWWLFATDGDRSADGHLHVWHGDSPRGPWTPHALNPVKCDVRSARPGGTPFSVDGVLYRPAQDDSGAYGGAIVINRIDELTPETFAETVIARLEPDPDGPYPSGVHTVSAVGESTLVDGKRYRLDPMAKLGRPLARVLRRFRRRRGP